MTHKQTFSTILLIAAAALVLQFIFHLNLYAQIIISIAGIIISIAMTVEMIKTIRSGKYGVDLLAITAVLATIAIGEYWASIIVLIMLTGGDTLEDYASKVAGQELQSLLDKNPQIAHLKKDDNISDIPVDQVKVYDTLLIKPGEVVPVDGEITKGNSTFDESSLTGESLPRTKHVSDTLLSGSINGEQAVEMSATHIAAESQYQSIVQLVKTANTHPAKFVRLADRYSVPFTIVAYLIAGIAWFISKDPVRFAEVLVVASPCPLILAAPIALVSGMSSASRNSIIVKNGTTIEKMAELKTIAFDKTGTITKGKLELAEVVSQNRFSTEQLLQYACTAEQQSSHILARSLLSTHKEIKLLPTDEITEITGTGLQAALTTGEIIKVGRQSFANPDHPNEIQISDTAIFISINNQFVGYITFKDQLRSETITSLKTLKKLGIPHTLLISGDQQAIAENIGKEAGIQEIHGNCLPEQKIKLLQQIPKKQHPVAMVGDGVNDAPSLAVADVGIAMGAHGSTAASEAADVVFLKDSLDRLPVAIQIARYTMSVAKQSVLIGIFICTILMLIAATGVIPALIGALFQEVVDTVTILWALRAHKSIKFIR
ncbi:heavy metal translocating P-type ATPase [Pediococcus argentinicus]|uniref:Cd(2+)-exporting ATPase n=1 Tax=Pediococcus argentinicus TaxID=480391 RepID=A0A0R2NGF3_9LACO|nr:heavy metal translocating P-type ATPase [Pediococcus argentinicus]KRO24872.1 cadmium-translocating P-type ATPase [Pediococcus argentinicus]NKZ22659.1 cadmium-translocating P-type ATPase [Pediococcus argentinicus]GEP19701.1 cobalt ABC transporter ATP-binding protein [Pediococcus argentinicus]